MKKKIKWISTTTSLIAALASIGGYKLSGKLMYIQQKDPNFIKERELKAKRYDENWYNSCDKIALNVESPNNYTISAILLRPLQTSNTIIICHGVTENKINSIRYARLFERLGFNSVIFDHRRHGESGGKTTSFGHYEKYDLQALIQTVKKIIGEEAILGIHGESMGAATMILYAGTVEDGADFYISDCAFSDFSKLLHLKLSERVKLNMALPIQLTNLFIRMRDGYWMGSITPAQAVAHIEKPVLFIHSLPDDLIPASMTVDLYTNKRGAKQLKLFEIGPHAQSFNQNPDEYEEAIHHFLTQYLKKDDFNSINQLPIAPI